MADYVETRMAPVAAALDRMSNLWEAHQLEHRRERERLIDAASRTRWAAWGFAAAMMSAVAAWVAVAVTLLR